MTCTLSHDTINPVPHFHDFNVVKISVIFQAGKAAASVSRLTDASKYTGSHKERFDESGKGKGLAGRKDIADSSGYVSGYQHKDTYDKTH